MSGLEAFIEFFERMPTWQRLIWVAVCMSAGWIAETGRPLFRFDYRKWVHAGVNLTLFVTVAAIGTGFAFGMVGLFAWIDPAGFPDTPPEGVLAPTLHDLLTAQGVAANAATCSSEILPAGVFFPPSPRKSSSFT